jgi:hypothetical protein
MRRTITNLCALAVAVFTGTAARAGIGTFDHLKCFSIHDRDVRNTVLTATLGPDQFPTFTDERCRIHLRARSFCIDVEKRNVRFLTGEPFDTTFVPAAEVRDYFCYDLRCPDEPLGIGLLVRDQFGERQIDVQSPDFLCAPAVKVP